jgi:rare lipoprotein A
MKSEAIKLFASSLSSAFSGFLRLFPIRLFLIPAGLFALAGCSAQDPARQAGGIDPRYGVRPSPRVVADGEEVPPGGGRYLVGGAYQIAGKTYYPTEKPIVSVGAASWYGSDFHGRRTANGEIFNRDSISAAHPTMPLPSYARVTNLRNSRSIIVRVNDRGPYHGNRVMDVSQRVADALDFRRSGTTRVKVEYVGRASLAGSDDSKLLASLRDDGRPAQLDGSPTVRIAAKDEPVRLASLEEPQVELVEASVATGEEPQADEAVASEDTEETSKIRFGETAPLPPIRPARLGMSRHLGMRQALD